MVNRPKQIGTAGETGVRRVLLAAGFSEHEAHRNVLKGAADEGDVWLRHPDGLIVIEVKSGKTAKSASYEQVEKWLSEAFSEAINARARMGVLVVQRAGFSPARAADWWCYLTDYDLNALRYPNWESFAERRLDYREALMVRIRYSELVSLVAPKAH